MILLNGKKVQTGKQVGSEPLAAGMPRITVPFYPLFPRVLQCRFVLKVMFLMIGSEQP